MRCTRLVFARARHDDRGVEGDHPGLRQGRRTARILALSSVGNARRRESPTSAVPSPIQAGSTSESFRTTSAAPVRSSDSTAARRSILTISGRSMPSSSCRRLSRGRSTQTARRVAHGVSRRRGRERSDHSRCRRDPERAGHNGRPGHPGERRGGDGLVLRVGAEPQRVPVGRGGDRDAARERSWTRPSPRCGRGHETLGVSMRRAAGAVGRRAADSPRLFASPAACSRWPVRLLSATLSMPLSGATSPSALRLPTRSQAARRRSRAAALCRSTARPRPRRAEREPEQCRQGSGHEEVRSDVEADEKRVRDGAGPGGEQRCRREVVDERRSPQRRESGGGEAVPKCSSTCAGRSHVRPRAPEGYRDSEQAE